MGSFDHNASLRLTAVLLWVAACQGGATCNRDGTEQASVVAEQGISGDIGDGVYEGNARVPFLYWTDGDSPALPEPLPAIGGHVVW